MTRRGKRVAAVAVLATVSLAAAYGFYGDRLKADPDRIQGDWTATTIAVGGEAVDVGKATGMGVRVSGDVWAITVKGSPAGAKRYRLALAPDRAPREIDLTQIGADGQPELVVVVGGRRQTVVQRGLYEFDGGTLRVAVARPSAARPTGFGPQADVIVTTYQRGGS